MESTFSALKRAIKSEFGNKIPSIEELISVLPKFFDKRSEERQKSIYETRLIIYHKNPVYRRALETASWDLNKGDMKLFLECLKMKESKEKDMSMEGDTIVEKFRGRDTNTYVGKYKSDGYKCNCSWFARNFMCRHLIFYRETHGHPIYDINMINKKYRTSRFKNVDEEVETESEDDGDIDNINERNGQLGSPGMEHILLEQMEANKKIPENVKWNKAYEVAKVCAQRIKDASNQQYELYLECLQSFSNMILYGMPLQVVDFLKNPDLYELKKIVPDSSPNSQSIDPIRSSITSTAASNSIASSIISTEISDSITSSSVSTTIDISAQPTVTENHTNINGLLSVHKEVPYNLKDAVGVDCVIYKVDGNGACIYNASAAHVYGDPSKADELRRESHKFIVKHWNYYRHFWSLPFDEIVGVGENKYKVHITTEADLIQFLLSD